MIRKIREMRKPTIYVAGPMRGYKDYNYPAFDERSELLREQGWNVINPADMDRADEKPNISGPMEFDPEANYEDHEFMRQALKRDMVALCDDCTAIYMLNGWEKSKGANAEKALAVALGLDVYYEDDKE
tara:strand:+ start:104 stop:490 length:387 start_codon:yes stop_codon:yes gene_type:complete